VTAQTYEEARTSLADMCRDLEQRGLVVGTAGNISIRTAQNVAITGTGVDFSQAAPNDIVLVDAEGTVIDGNIAPSSETALHLYAYQDTAVGAVDHTHSPAATAVSVLVDELPCIHYQQLLLGGAVPVVPFAVFGSQELATSVSQTLAGRKAVILANHGAVTVGRDLNEAAKNARLLEWASDLYIRAASAGQPRPLTLSQQGDVVHAALHLNDGIKKPANRTSSQAGNQPISTADTSSSARPDGKPV
jgi:L-fuculose-phosphate aldolase